VLAAKSAARRKAAAECSLKSMGHKMLVGQLGCIDASCDPGCIRRAQVTDGCNYPAQVRSTTYAGGRRHPVEQSGRGAAGRDGLGPHPYTPESTLLSLLSSPQVIFGIYAGGMLDVYLHDGARSLRFVLSGTLTRPWTEDLEHSWHTATSILYGKQLVVNLAGLSQVDEDGIRLLTLMSQSGARLITASDSTGALARGISGRDPVVLSAPPMGFLRSLICRFKRCCLHHRSRLFLRIGCGRPPMKIW
jgi:ABC-type transporter Mla MlaB component